MNIFLKIKPVKNSNNSLNIIKSTGLVKTTINQINREHKANLEVEALNPGDMEVCAINIIKTLLSTRYNSK